MKKIFRVFLITLGLILLLLIALPVLFKSRIEQEVKTQVNKHIQAHVDWDKLSLSLFRGFPDLSVNLHRLSVVGRTPFEGDTLAGLERFELQVNLFSALKKELQVKSILLYKPLINGIVLEDGTANWDIAKHDPATETDAPDEADPGQAFTIALKNLKVKDGRVFYDDASQGINASLRDFEMDLSGDFASDLTLLDLHLDVGEVNAWLGGVRYLTGAIFELDAEAEANLLEDSYTLQENEIRLNELVLGATGVIKLLEKGAMDLDLSFFSKETDFRTLLSMVPAVYRKDFEDIETRGKLQLEGRILGLMQDTLMPDASLNLQVRDGYFAYPGLPKDVSDVQINMRVDYKGKDLDASTVDIQQFKLLLGGNPFELNMRVAHPVSDMHVAGEARGLIDFASLKEVLPLEDVTLQGRLETDLSWDTRMSYMEQEAYEQVDLDGSLLLEHVHVETADLPVPLDLTILQMEFNPQFVELVNLDLQLGSSDLHMDGNLRNFIPYLFDGQTVYGALNVSADFVDANEFMPEVAADAPAVDRMNSDSILAAPPDSLAKPARLRIPENVEFELTLEIDKIRYTDIEVDQVSGSMKLGEGVAHLDGLSMQVIEGEVSGSGKVDTRGEFTNVDMQMKLNGVDIRSAYTQFVSVERLAPMAKYCRGTANVDVQFQSQLDASFTPLYESIDATGKLFTSGLEIHDLNSFVKLSQMLQNDKFTDIVPDEVEASFTVRDGRISFTPFDMAFESSKITMSGSHGIDLTLDYLLDMDIAKRDLGKGANDLMNGMALLAAGAGIKIPQSDYVKVKANIRGTFNEPRVTTDLSGNLKSASETAVEAVEENLRLEVEKVEEQVREEAGVQAEQLISEAEAEAERLLEEARKAGEALVNEADKQGARLVEEAGDHALKQMAAKRAAQELKRQAEKQAESLIEEAQAQADELIKQAREEAEKL